MSTEQIIYLPSTDHSDHFLRISIKWSIIGHGILLVFVLLKSLIFPHQTKPYIPSLRVDLVALPDLLKKDVKTPSKFKQEQFHQEILQVLKKAEIDAKRIQQAAKEKTPPKKDDMIIPQKAAAKNALEATIKKNQNALRRLKSLEKIKLAYEQEKPPEKVDTLIKGNILSKGSSVSTDARESDMESYTGVVESILKENWQLSPWLKRQNLKARVRILINPQGMITRIDFTQLSGNSKFDDEIRKLLQKSQPFPPPPPEQQGSLMSDGISIGIPL